MRYPFFHNFGLSIRDSDFTPHYSAADLVDSGPEEIAVDVEVTHYHGDYFGIMRSDNLAAHCSYHADPQTARWLRTHMGLGNKFQYVVGGEKYEKAAFRIREAVE